MYKIPYMMCMVEIPNKPHFLMPTFTSSQCWLMGKLPESPSPLNLSFPYDLIPDPDPSALNFRPSWDFYLWDTYINPEDIRDFYLWDNMCSYHFMGF